MFPWKLDEGIYFEDASLLLPWGAAINDLLAVGPPEVLDRGSSLHLTWRNCRVLGGLEVHANACQIREEPNPRAYHIYLPALHWISFDIVEADDEPALAHRQLRSLHDHFARELGPATFSYPGYSRKLPSIFWEQPPLQLAIGSQSGGTRLHVSIKHTPSGYAALKAEAERIRKAEGKGARVDYVAWHEPYDR